MYPDTDCSCKTGNFLYDIRYIVFYSWTSKLLPRNIKAFINAWSSYLLLGTSNAKCDRFIHEYGCMTGLVSAAPINQINVQTTWQIYHDFLG